VLKRIIIIEFHKKMKSYLLLIFLLSAVFCDWKHLVDIATLTYSYGLYTDSNKIVHVVYCKTKGDFNSLMYAKLNPDGTISSEKIISEKEDCRTVFMEGKDGKLYVVYHVAKIAPGLFPTDYLSGNIFFTQSDDNGNTWSKPTLVHTPSNDIIDRYDPRIVVNHANGRVWVAYKSRGKEDPTDLLVVSKPPGSQIFSSPMKVATIGKSSILPGGLKFNLAMDAKGLPILHITWEDKDMSTDYLYDLFYAKSTDNGNTWTRPLSLGKTNIQDMNFPFTLATYGENTLIFTFTRNDAENKGVYQSYSKDAGANWTPAKKISSSEDHLAVVSKICLKKPTLFMLMQDQILQKANYAAGTVDLENYSVAWIGNPFGKAIEDCYSPRITCQGEYVIFICKAHQHDEENDELKYAVIST